MQAMFIQDLLATKHLYDARDAAQNTYAMHKPTEGEHTGKSVNYYQVEIKSPTTPGRPQYIAECNDIIEALGMTFAEANVFKAQWRIAAERTLGLKKQGNTPLYDAEKIVFFGERQVIKYSGDKN
jgi:hypothetical protein